MTPVRSWAGPLAKLRALTHPLPALLLVLLTLAAGSIVPWQVQGQQAPQPPRFRFYANRGGGFRLTRHDGQPWDLRSVRGQTVLLTFGYSFCPDICPTTLVTLAGALRDLEAGGVRAHAVFITLDPMRDTPARLAAYMANFGGGMTGLTGREEEVQAVARQYHVKFAVREGTPGLGPLIDHSAFIYLIDTQGRLRYLFPHTTPPGQIAEAVRLLQNER